MDKRKFLKLSGSALAIATINPFFACSSQESNSEKEEQSPTQSTGNTAFTLPALGYAKNALAPHIDEMTMDIHHGRHHAGYVSKLNAAVEGTDYAGKGIVELLNTVKPGDTNVRNNGGGHYNHTLFWEILSPAGGGQPSGKIAEAIDGQFGSYAAFKAAFSSAATSVFGSGWAWLMVTEDKKLAISSTPNQDNPLMSGIVKEKGTPILGIDVREHAYYLNYQNERGRYVDNFFNVVNWENVAKNFDAIG